MDHELKKRIVDLLEEYNSKLNNLWYNSDSDSACKGYRATQDKISDVLEEMRQD